MADYSRLLEILKKLIAFETVSGNQKTVSLLYDYIEQLFKGYQLYTNRYISNGFESLVISATGGKHAKVLLQAHIDVVPGYPEQFIVEQREGKLYGRGVYDMKFAAACFTRLLEDLGNDAGNYDVALMLTADEEVNGRNGVQYLLGQGYTADVCILPDSGEDWNIEASAKGFSIVDVSAQGKSAHGSRPWEADNAAVKLLTFLGQVTQEFPFTKPLDTTVALTRLSAGPAYNQIPGEATATFDIRFPDEAAYEILRKRFEKLCLQHDITAEFTRLADSVQHDVNSPYVEIWQAITTKVTGREPTYTHSFGSSDARYLVPQGITTILARPSGRGAHAPDEWIIEEELYEYYEVVKQFVLATAYKQVDL